MCQRCKFIESREELPHNIMEVFHNDVHHKVDPRVELITINIKTSIVGLIYRPMDMDDSVYDDEGIIKMDIPVPYTRIEVPIINNNTISPKDISEAANLFPSDVTMTQIREYIDSLDGIEDYIVVAVEPRSPAIALLAELMGELLS